MTLYLKYRPKKLNELDLVSVRESLTKIINSGSLPHAFLFAGPKGTGKTSAARILAKVVNCERNDKKLGEPCDRCDQCQAINQGTNIDIIEIDAASHRGIDDIRALRDAVKLAPASARKKIYIIDEAHMLTLEASNALLKTLEEPPGHVLFILATTNPEKLIETIKSRTTIINFQAASEEEIVSSLQKKAKGEKVGYDNDSLKIIAALSEGSFRDATKIMEQLIQEGRTLQKLNLDDLAHWGMRVDVNLTLEKISAKDEQWLLDFVEETVKKGTPAMVLIDNLIGRLHRYLVTGREMKEAPGKSFNTDEVIYLIDSLLDAKRQTVYAPIEQVPLECVIIRWCRKNQQSPDGQIKPETPVPTSKENKTPAFKAQKVTKTGRLKSADKITDKVSGDLTMSDDLWSKVLWEIKQINPTVEALLRAAKPSSFDGSTLKLGVYYKFHKERLEEEKHRRILETSLKKIIDADIRVTCFLTEPQKVKEIKKEEVVLTEGDDKDIISMAKKIFS